MISIHIVESGRRMHHRLNDSLVGSSVSLFPPACSVGKDNAISFSAFLSWKRMHAHSRCGGGLFRHAAPLLLFYRNVRITASPFSIIFCINDRSAARNRQSRSFFKTESICTNARGESVGNLLTRSSIRALFQQQYRHNIITYFDKLYSHLVVFAVYIKYNTKVCING